MVSMLVLVRYEILRRLATACSHISGKLHVFQCGLQTMLHDTWLHRTLITPTAVLLAVHPSTI